jgi:hypothetical protein
LADSGLLGAGEDDDGEAAELELALRLSLAEHAAHPPAGQ